MSIATGILQNIVIASAFVQTRLAALEAAEARHG